MLHRSALVPAAAFHLVVATMALLTVATGQETPAPPPAGEQEAAPKREEPHFLVRRYPRDRDTAIATVGTRTLTLGDLVDHLDERHHPGFRKALEVRPEIQRMLQSDLIAPWVRHFADAEALRQTAGKVDEAKLTEAQSATLKTRFQNFLDSYTADRRTQGRPDPTEKLVNSLLADFQLRNGLGIEVEGWLDYLEPDDYSRGQLQNFFTDNPRVFGGRVNIAHILIQHRDAGTGILLGEKGTARAMARLTDIRARLLPDGSNFEEVARLFSDDTKTAPLGGALRGIARFDDRLPATLCRAAWNLQDGQVSDVVETQYGWHLVKRIDFEQQVFILFTDDAIPSIRQIMRRMRQEQRLFAARQKVGVQLML